MSEQVPQTSSVREIGLGELVPGAPLRKEFEALHEAWIGRGVARWLSWIDPGGPHPIVVLAAFGSSFEGAAGALQAVLIGLWAPAPIDRFDTLFEVPPDRFEGGRAGLRPEGGCWHFIAVTARPGVTPTHLGLGRLLVGHALEWVRARGHREARTLSPVVGLPALEQLWRVAGRSGASLARIVARSALADGRPYLQILRLHLGGGARLERVLGQSRRDDAASGMANLRFVYSTDPAVRAVQRERWTVWCRGRADAMADGLGTRLGAIGDDEIWYAPALTIDDDVFAIADALD